MSVICQRCGSVDDYRTVISGPHIKAICNGCDRYIKFISRTEIDYCPICGKAGSLKTEEYGCFHTITKCSNCNYSDITTINKTLLDVQPVINKIMAQEQFFAPGIRLFDKHPNAPDFVLASQVITLDEFFDFCRANPQVLADYQGKKQLKLQILRSKDGKIYAAVDTYGTPAATTPAPAPQQQAPAQWGSPVPAAAPVPVQNGWGAPQQQPVAATTAPYADDLPF